MCERVWFFFVAGPGADVVVVLQSNYELQSANNIPMGSVWFCVVIFNTYRA